MSLADLLSFGKKEVPEELKPPDATEIKRQQRLDRWKKQQAAEQAAEAAPKPNSEELELLKHQVSMQALELEKQEEQEEAAKKRALEDAVEQVAAMAKRRREDKVKDIPEGAYRGAHCRFFAIGQCERGLDCPFAHGTENLNTPANVPQTVGSGPPCGPPCGGGSMLNLASRIAEPVETVSFKTQFCKYFEVGACKNGPQCCYAHDVMELRGREKMRLLSEQTAMIHQMGNDWTQWPTNSGTSIGGYDASTGYGNDQQWNGSGSVASAMTTATGSTDGQWQTGGFSSGQPGFHTSSSHWQDGSESSQPTLFMHSSNTHGMMQAPTPSQGGPYWAARAGGSGGGGSTGHQEIMCSAHGKKRSFQNMEQDGIGGYRCASSSLCQGASGGGKAPYPAWSVGDR